MPSVDDTARLYTMISDEEREAVFAKMVTMAKQPAGHLLKQDELYLEQQLVDMLGFEVSAELEGYRLPQSIGTACSQPHMRRYPLDALEHHDECPEAGLSKSRGRFGWFTQLGQLTPESITQEKYALSVPFDDLDAWKQNPTTVLNWFRWRKMVLINPIERRAVVGVVANVGPNDRMRFQFGASPEIVRSCKIWSVPCRGKVLLFFVNDPENRVPVGPISLENV